MTGADMLILAGTFLLAIGFGYAWGWQARGYREDARNIIAWDDAVIAARTKSGGPPRGDA